MKVLLIFSVCIVSIGCNCCKRSLINDFVPSQWVSDTAVLSQIERYGPQGKERAYISIPSLNERTYQDYYDFKDSAVYLPERLVAGRDISLPQLIEPETFTKGELITGEDLHTVLKLLMPYTYNVIMGLDTTYGRSQEDINTYKVYLEGRANISEQINAIIVSIVYGKGIFGEGDSSSTYLVTLKDSRVLSKFVVANWNGMFESICHVCPGNLFIVQHITLVYFDSPPGGVQPVGYGIYKILDDGHVRFLQKPDELKELN